MDATPSKRIGGSDGVRFVAVVLVVSGVAVAAALVDHAIDARGSGLGVVALCTMTAAVVAAWWTGHAHPLRGR